MNGENYEIKVITDIVAKNGSNTQRTLFYQFGFQFGNSSKGTDFRLQITDPDDPLFLFDFNLSSTGYTPLKKEQKLFCDFNEFPNSIHRLLTCVNENGDFKALIDEFEYETPTLVLQQVTTISLLIHLQLPLVAATDARLKEFLSKETRLCKMNVIKANEKIRNLEQIIQTQKQQYEEKIRTLEEDLKQASHDHNMDRQKLISECQERIKQVRTEQETEKQFLDKGFISKEQAIVARYEKQIEDLRKKLNTTINEKHEIDTSYQRQMEKNSHLEAQISDMRMKLQKTEQEHRETSNRVIEHTKQETALQTELNSLKSKLLSAQQIIEKQREREHADGNTVDTLRAELEEKEREIREMSEQVEDLSKRAAERDWIAEKARKVILNNQNSLKTMKMQRDEAREMNQILHEKLEETHNRSMEAEENMRRYSMTVKQQRDEITTIKTENEKLQERIESLEKALELEQEYTSLLRDQIEKRKQRNMMPSPKLEHRTPNTENKENNVPAKGRSIPSAFLKCDDSSL